MKIQLALDRFSIDEAISLAHMSKTMWTGLKWERHSSRVWHG